MCAILFMMALHSRTWRRSRSDEGTQVPFRYLEVHVEPGDSLRPPGLSHAQYQHWVKAPTLVSQVFDISTFADSKGGYRPARPTEKLIPGVWVARHGEQSKARGLHHFPPQYSPVIGEVVRTMRPPIEYAVKLSLPSRTKTPDADEVHDLLGRVGAHRIQVTVGVVLERVGARERGQRCTGAR